MEAIRSAMGTTSPTSSLSQETDADLVVFVGMAADGPAEAEAALEMLYNRHAGDLKAYALESGFFGKGVDIDTAVIRTFQKIWQHAARFDPKKLGLSCDPDRAVKLWLIKILKNECRDALRKIVRRNEDPLDLEYPVPGLFRPSPEGEDGLPISVGLVVHESESADSPEHWSRYRILYQEWSQTLSPADQDLMRLSAEYTQAVPPHKCEIPADELQALAVAMEVLPETIKVKRQRLKQQAESYILARY